MIFNRLPGLRLLAMILGSTLATHANVQAATPDPAVPDSNEIFQWVNDITSFGVRSPGSPGSLGASQYVHDRFSEWGLQKVAFEEADTKVWSASKWGLTVEGQALACSPMQHTFHQGVPTVFSTGPGGRQAELVYVGNGADSDFWFKDVRGKIVVANAKFGKKPLWLFKPFLLALQDTDKTFGWDYNLVDPYAGGGFPDSYYRAMRKGAVGFVGVLNDYFDSHQYRNEAYRAYDPGQAMAIPGLWMAPVAGSQLAERAKAGKLKAALTLEGQLAPKKGRAVVGYLPGMSDEIVLVESHHDSATTGATEDASGTASVMALARYFAKLPRSQRPRTLMFATMDTHFTDYAVHKAFIRRHLLESNPLGEKVVAVVTLEHIAQEWLPGKDKKPMTTGLVAPRALMVSTEIEGFKDIVVTAMKEHQLERSFAVSTALTQLVGGEPGLPADSSDFLRAGVPVIALVGAPLYLYDDIDTPDKVAKDELGRVAQTFVDVVRKVSQLPSANFKRLPYKLDD
ncbi:M28 family peptidase [Aquabacterium sp.]|uniref:M28 family peptidase n=1 Tax=Aquabacterium sp. TaxID=1872578 RepID=UPI003D6CDECC